MAPPIAPGQRQAQKQLAVDVAEPPVRSAGDRGGEGLGRVHAGARRRRRDAEAQQTEVEMTP